MKQIKFRWPYKGKLSRDSHINYNDRPIGQVTNIEETEDGLVVTGEFTKEFTEGPDYERLFIEPDKGFYSLGPIPANPDNYIEYSKADAEMTMALYGVHPDVEGSWIKPGTKWGCLTVILASIGLWVLIYTIIHWIVTGEILPTLDWS